MQGGHEWGYIILAQLLLENNGDLADMHQRIMQIEKLANQGQNRSISIQVLRLKSSLNERKGEKAKAEACLEKALQCGFASGYFQTFSDQAQGLQSVALRLLKNIPSTNGAYLDYVQAVTDLSSEPKDNNSAVSSTGLVEELTQRELEVLEQISAGLSNREISQTLFLSPGTVKWYTSNIYGKLGVRSRTEAALLAKELGLLP